MPDQEVQRYAAGAYKAYAKDSNLGMYPEGILQELDEEWMTVPPSPSEAMLYPSNSHYLRFLMARIGSKEGKDLERLAGYVLSTMPGCHVARRKRTRYTKTDYDIVCSLEGLQTDFRAELGRYFVCECKDWRRKPDFTSMAKFCRVLDSIRSRFGILFSRKNITGLKRLSAAAAEQLRILHDRGIVIVVIDEEDLDRIANGANFITMLRSRYETVRLELRD